MNNKADMLMRNVIWLVLVALFFFLSFAFVQQQSNGASYWEDYYAKELAKVINGAKPGDEIRLDVHKATEVALSNGIDFNEIFQFSENKVCVKLGKGRSSCYNYFNNVKVIKEEIDLGQETDEFGEAVNVLPMRILS